MPLQIGHSHRVWMQKFQENPRGPWGTLNPNTLAPSTENTNTGLGSPYGYPPYDAQIHEVDYFRTTPVAWEAKLVEKNQYAQGMGPGLYGPQLGGIVDDLASVANQVLTDPALPQVIYLMNRIVNAPSSGGAAPSSGGVPTINLQDFVGPLEVVAWYRENPVWGKVAIAGVVLFPVLVGYVLGRSLKKCTTKQATFLGRAKRRR